MEDTEVLKLIRNGDSNAYVHIVNKYHRRLLNFIYATIGDERFVEDIGQETFVNAFKSINTFDCSKGVPFSAWLFGIAKNRCFSELRKKKRGLHITLDDAENLAAQNRSAESSFIYEERLELIANAIAQIPEPFKTALKESIQGKSIAQSAHEKNIAVGTIKSRIARARSQLRILLKGDVNENF